MRPLVVRLLFIAILISNGIDDPVAAQFRPVGEPDTRLENGNSYLVQSRRLQNEDWQEISRATMPVLLISAHPSAATDLFPISAFSDRAIPSANLSTIPEIRFLLLALQP